MANASAYKDFYDDSLQFTEEEIRGYTPQAFGEGRIRDLTHLARIAHRIPQLGLGKEAFWAKVQKRSLDLASWYALAMGLPGIDREGVLALPEASSADGKALTVEAHKLADSTESAQEWVEEYTANRNRDMVYVVSIGRRAQSLPSAEWKRQERSLSNKLANCVSKETKTAQDFSSWLGSRSG